MSDGSSEGESSRLGSLDATLSQLSRLFSLSRYDKQQARLLVDRVVSIGNRRGFSDREATQVAQLALKGSPKQLGSKLLRNIYPANNVQFGDQLILSIAGALGPSEDGVADRSKDGRIESELSDEDDSDQDNGLIGGKKRMRVVIEVQAAALRLLNLLVSPPPIMTSALDVTQSDSSQWTFPLHFLSTKARRALDSSYSIFFHYLDYQTLRPHLCHLLSLTTRRKHVRHYRLEKLLALRRNDPGDSNIEALLKTYSAFLPMSQYADVTVNHDMSAQQTGGLRHPDLKWLLHIKEIWNSSENNQDIASLDREGHAPLKRRKVKNSRRIGGDSPVVSLARTLLPGPVSLSLHENSLMITEVMSFKSLGYSIDRLQLPTQLVSALVHKFTAVALLAELKSGTIEDEISRITYWAISALGEEMRLPTSRMVAAQDRISRSDLSHQKSHAMLLTLARFVERMGGCSLPLQRWVSKLLQPSIWSTLYIDEQEAILEMVHSFVPSDYKTISSQLLEPLKVLIEAAQQEEAARLFNSLTRLLDRWVMGRNWADIAIALEGGNTEIRYGFLSLSSQVDYIDTITQTIRVAVYESSRLLVRFPRSVQVMDANLSLHELIFKPQFVALNPFRLPPLFAMHLYSMSQVGSLVSFSRHLNVINQIRELHYHQPADDYSINASISVEEMPKLMKENHKWCFCADSRADFDRFTVYAIELMWRANGFWYQDIDGGDNNLGLPQEFFQQLGKQCEERGDDLDKLGILYHGAILATSMETHASEIAIGTGILIQGPLSPELWKKVVKKSGALLPRYGTFRDKHLQWLGDRGATGVRDFCHAAIHRFLRHQIEAQERTRGDFSSTSVIE